VCRLLVIVDYIFKDSECKDFKSSICKSSNLVMCESMPKFQGRVVNKDLKNLIHTLMCYCSLF
jgi:hypothetical protein